MTDGKRPESALERALRALEVGSQSSFEGGDTVGDPTLCARCLRHERTEDGQLCAGCRAFLLDDTPVDPTTASVPGEGGFNVVFFDPANVTGFPVPTGPERLTAEHVGMVTELVQTLVSTLVQLGEQAAAAALAVVRATPPELLALSVELEHARLTGVALGLSEERCEAVVHEEVDRSHGTLEDLQRVPERVRQRLQHEVRACACAAGDRVCAWAGRAPVRSTWQAEPS